MYTANKEGRRDLLKFHTYLMKQNPTAANDYLFSKCTEQCSVQGVHTANKMGTTGQERHTLKFHPESRGYSTDSKIQDPTAATKNIKVSSEAYCETNDQLNDSHIFRAHRQCTQPTRRGEETEVPSWSYGI